MVFVVIFFMYQSEKGVMLMKIIESSATVLSFILSLIDQIKSIRPINNGGKAGTTPSHRRAINYRATYCSSFLFIKISKLL